MGCANRTATHSGKFQWRQAASSFCIMPHQGNKVRTGTALEPVNATTAIATTAVATTAIAATAVATTATATLKFCCRQKFG